MNLDDLDYVTIGHWATTYAHLFAVTYSLSKGSPYKSEGGSSYVHTSLISPELASRIPPNTGTWESPSAGLTLTNPSHKIGAVLHRTAWTAVACWLDAWPAADRDEALTAARLIAALTERPDEHIEPSDDQEAVADKIARRAARLEGGDTACITDADRRIRDLVAARLRPGNYALF